MAEGLGEFFKGGKGNSGGEPVGMDLVVSGTVPPGSGLSVNHCSDHEKWSSMLIWNRAPQHSSLPASSHSSPPTTLPRGSVKATSSAWPWRASTGWDCIPAAWT